MSENEPGSVTDLLRKAQAGDLHALADLRTKMGPFVKAIAGPKLAGPVAQRIGNEDDLEASVGANFFAQPDRLKKMESQDRSHLKNTLAKATRQKIIDYYRKADCRVGAVTETDLHQDAESPRPLDNHSAQDDPALLLAEAIEELPALHRQVAELRFAQHSERDIAEQLNLTRHQVGVILRELGEHLLGE